MAFSHQSHAYLAGGQGLGERIGCQILQRRDGETKGGPRILNEGMIGAAALGPVAMFHSPLGHSGGGHRFIGEGGDDHGHGGRTTAITADVVRAVGLRGPGLFRLVEIDHVHIAASENLPAFSLGEMGDARGFLLLGGLEGGIGGQLAGRCLLLRCFLWSFLFF